ncbi:MAG: DUF2283 domain-containing protein [Pseudomonadales bacterium]|nr:DUF2283 domain-containing protein [Pseudomonadales bacterium]
MSQRISLKCGDDPDVAYLILPKHPGEGSKSVVKEQKDLRTLIENYKGPDVYLDFDQNGILIGIEIIA